MVRWFSSTTVFSESSPIRMNAFVRKIALSKHRMAGTTATV